MATSIEWKAGDRIIHTGKPEWGIGSVTQAVATTHEGQACQRLTVRFENSGLKTLSTAFATLAVAAKGAGAADPEPVKSWLEEMEATNPADQLRTLPESATDPFRSLETRIQCTLDLYTIGSDGRSLIAWATSMTGLSDPLSRMSRHELEQAYSHFEIVRDRHLVQLLQQAAKSRISVENLLRSAPPAAQQVLRRANGWR